MLNKLWGSGPWFGSTRICRAAEADDLGTVKTLATQSPQLVNQAGWMGWAPLHKGSFFFRIPIPIFLFSLLVLNRKRIHFM
jgi:hypothetical protein